MANTNQMQPLESPMPQSNNLVAQRDCIGITLCGVLSAGRSFELSYKSPN